ncbi:hypothetical protein AKJ09_01003 [Labilithrix luteola]|uniref:Uncharacterized protein n=1 Tax=Labilithrix luteola TaxID=1391654 RepID=A0A0K1PMJ8_9BACT|nr:hypothetical protein [Labilithrix luteola]AKU94339.1 hypothetical protein AKJ09_01003 [Labilithrix luteola]
MGAPYSLFASITAILVLSACSFEQHEAVGENQIVFGITQSISADTGQPTTKAAYELLELDSQGWKTRAFVDHGRSCWLERLDSRLGQPRVESGVATFRGGSLPTTGLAVLANANTNDSRVAEAVVSGSAWADGDTLTFEAHGFAMPNVGRVRLQAPSTLAVATPAPPSAGASELAISTKGDFTVTWASDEAKGGHVSSDKVAVVLEADGAGQAGATAVELRCFFERSAGTGVVPKDELSAFLTATRQAQPSTSQDGAVHGKLTVATHTQKSLTRPGGWVIYVVAEAMAREQPFAARD